MNTIIELTRRELLLIRWAIEAQEKVYKNYLEEDANFTELVRVWKGLIDEIKPLRERIEGHLLYE